MPNVKIRENEPFEVALRRFKRTCEKAGVVAEVRSREFYEKPTSIRKREKAAAVKRNIKNLKRELNRRTRLYWLACSVELLICKINNSTNNKFLILTRNL